MKLFSALFVALSLVLTGFAQTSGSKAKPRKNSLPASQANAFYHTYVKLKVSGLPNEEQMKTLSPFFTDDLLKLFAAAKVTHDRFVREHPDEKPPWGDGDLFSSLFEGAQTFKVGKATVKADRADVPVQLAYQSGGKTTNWTDVLVLRRTDKGWLVDDILMKGEWQFKSGNSLRSILTSE